MKKPNIFVLAFTLLAAVFNSCVKPQEAIDDLKQSCLYDDKTDYFKKWANTVTTIDSVDASGSIVNTQTTYPIGYFWINADGTYKVLSNEAPRSGVWDVTTDCKFALDANSPMVKQFEVISLTTDSLIIRRKEGPKTYTQHYVAFNCFDLDKMLKQWDNTETEIQYYNENGSYSSYIIHPAGYFTLSTNTYERFSDGDFLAGNWKVDNECRLVLDPGTNLERSFEIQKLTNDSLVIWRKDLVNRTNYLQKYIKHQ
ncbi:hypothetical protein ACFQZX_06435 [Mucilaginibacter litoreus]|uniref:Lipocalin-like domain-containing protein n=1 Tax=Mucilaginibacter litoreus TaxID=1048221 RepID=A0ABW3AQC6_9SPHI